MAMTPPAANVDSYIASQPADIQPILAELRQLIKDAAPHAEETISYAMPAYKYHGMLVYFAAWKNHYGFYPGNAAIVTELFKEELKPFAVSKGTIQFPYDKPLPRALIQKIVKERVKQNEATKAAKELAKKTVTKTAKKK